MIDISSLPDAVHALKAASDITKLIISSHDARIIREKAVELQGQIFTAQQNALSAQSSQFSLLERVRELEKQIADLEAWDAEKQRYALTSVEPGVFAYVLKPDAQPSEPPHWLCTTCYQSGKKSILQISTMPQIPQNQMSKNWICSSCPTKIRTELSVNP
jgi:hypothetical protein